MDVINWFPTREEAEDFKRMVPNLRPHLKVVSHDGMFALVLNQPALPPPGVA